MGLICNRCQMPIKKRLDGSCYCSIECRDVHREKAKKYYNSDEYKKRKQSPGWKERMRNYRCSEKGREAKRRYLLSDKYKEYKKKKKTYVCPSQAVNDYVAHAKRITFHSKEERKQDILNYSKVVCGIQGNCERVAERITKKLGVKNGH